MIEFVEAKKGDIVIYCPVSLMKLGVMTAPEEVTIRDNTVHRGQLIYTITNWFTGQSWDTDGETLHLYKARAKFFGVYYQELKAEGNLSTDDKKKIKKFQKEFPEYSF